MKTWVRGLAYNAAGVLFFLALSAHAQVQQVQNSLIPDLSGILPTTRPLTLLQAYQDAVKDLHQVREEKIINQAKTDALENTIADQKQIVATLQKTADESETRQQAAEIKREIAAKQAEIKRLSQELTRHQNSASRIEEKLALHEEQVGDAKKRLVISSWFYFKKLLAILGFVLLMFVVRFLIVRYTQRRARDISVYYFVRRTANLVTFLAIVSIILFLIFENITGALTIIGLAAAGIAIALHDFFASLVGWLILVSMKGVRPGHRVQVGDVVGDVIEIGVFWTRLQEVGRWMNPNTETGRGIFLMNNFIFKGPIINYHFGSNYIWQRIDIDLTFESHWEKALRLFEGLLLERTRRYMERANIELMYMRREQNMSFVEHKADILFGIEPCGYHYTFRYMVTPADAVYVRDMMSKEISKIVQAHADIEFEHPTRRVVTTVNKRNLNIQNEKEFSL